MKNVSALILFLFTTIQIGMTQDFYDLSLQSASGETINFKDFKGKKVLLVNVASKCGYTSQYAQLQDLHNEFPELVILGIPCNDFGGQEPGTEQEIVQFCQKNYGVDFTITEKVKIKGESHPVYAYLTNKEANGVGDHTVKWNFHKFLIDESGKVVASLPSGVSPIDEQILAFAKGE